MFNIILKNNLSGVISLYRLESVVSPERTLNRDVEKTKMGDDNGSKCAVSTKW